MLWNADRFIDSEVFGECFSDVRESCKALGLFEEEESAYYRQSLYESLGELKESSKDGYRRGRNLKRKDGTYLFPFKYVPQGSKIVIYGAGKVGQTFYRQVLFSEWCEIVSWVDRSPKKESEWVCAADKIKDLANCCE